MFLDREKETFNFFKTIFQKLARALLNNQEQDLFLKTTTTQNINKLVLNRTH